MDHKIEQGTAAWHQCRLGKATASKIADIIAKTKSGPSASRAKYAAQLVCERLTGNPTETFCSPAMMRGNEKEPEARRAYEFLADCDVELIGFVDHPEIAMSGASPDGLVGDDGLLEIKAPDSHTHIETLLKRAVPARYVTQMQWQMACTGRSWCDYVSFDDRLPEPMRLFVQRIERDDEAIAEMEKEVSLFLKEVGDTVDELMGIYQPELEAA